MRNWSGYILPFYRAMVPRAFVIFPHSSEQYLDRFNQFHTKTVKDIRKKIPKSTLEE